ncbi:MAG: hypothetical protein MJZ38_04820 [archaeon]|nr:hypothetical protein [archaeon]
MLGFGFGKKDVPEKIRKVGLTKWHDALSDNDKVKLKRYLDNADGSSVTGFILSVMTQAIEDHNYKFVASVYESVKEFDLSDNDRFDILDAAIIGVFNAEDYEHCLELCNQGLAMLKDKNILGHVMARGHGEIPGDIHCRNYKINVLVGILYDFDQADRTLLDYVEMGLLSEEDLEYRRNGIKTFRLQRTFDNIFNIKKAE